MNFLVIGTDHTIQREPGFAGLLRGWLCAQRDGYEAVAEETSDALPPSAARRVAEEYGLRWYNLDMTVQEKADAGILGGLREQRFSSEHVHRNKGDEVREAAMIEKLLNSGSQTTLVICGYVHFDPLVKKLRAEGHLVETRVYLETVPEIHPPSNPGD